MKIRIHHFFDIIHDFGSNKEIVPHSYLHSYHKVAHEIRENANIEFEIVLGVDDVCERCIHLQNSGCDDLINHRKDFTEKEGFNNYLDKRIIEICAIQLSVKYSPIFLCEIAHKYIEKIEFIYQGNDKEHTLLRKRNVILGLKYYSEKHRFPINADI